MGNYDQMAAAVSELSGGKNVVLLDDIGMPSIYVRIPKGKNSELVSGLSDNVHYAFNVDSVEKTAFYYSKYQNIIVNERAYSLGHRDPANSINWDAARKACENKGAGFHLATMAEWAYIAGAARMALCRMETIITEKIRLIHMNTARNLQRIAEKLEDVLPVLDL